MSHPSLWQKLLSVFRSSQRDILSTDLIVSKLESLESAQALLLQRLEEISNANIPKNNKGLYKVGTTRIIHYLNELTPQIYLTLVSVLQGVALSILVDKFRFDYLADSPIVYFYFASSFLVIVNFWYAFQIVILIRSWPLHFIDALIYFTAAAAQSVGYKNVIAPSYWFASMAGMCFVFVFAYSRQLSINSRIIKEGLNDEAPQEVIKHQSTIRIYIGFFLLATILALILTFVTWYDPANLIAASLAISVPVVYTMIAIREARSYGIDELG